MTSSERSAIEPIEDFAHAYERLTAMQALVSDVLRDVVHCSPDAVPTVIDDSLARIGRFCAVDRAYVFEMQPGHRMSNTYEWCAEGVSPEIETLQDLPCDVIHFWLEPMTAGQPVAVPHVQALPDSRADERDLLDRQGIQSLLVVPMLSSGALFGFVGFDSVRSRREFVVGERSLLTSMADVICAALLRRKAARDVTDAQARLAAITEQTSDLVCVIDASGTVAWASASVQRLLGHDLTGRCLWAECEGNQGALLKAAVQALLAEDRQGAVRDVPDCVVETRFGPRWLASRVVDLRHQPAIAGIVFTARDVTVRRKAQEQLEAIASTVPGALHNYRVRPDNTQEVDFISDGAREIWEFDPTTVKDVLEQLWKSVKPEFVASLQRSVATSAETMTPWIMEWQIETPSGKTKWLEGRGSPRKLDDGSTEWSTIILDVTERHRVEEALARSQALNIELQKFESIGKLSGGIAHDFNNLLAIIQGNLELSRYETLSDEGRAGFDDAIAACQRGATLTQQLLTFGRRAMLQPKPLNLNAAVGQLGTLIRRTFKENIDIEIVEADKLRTTMIDHSAFDNAMLNAALNARDAMPEGGQLTIETANVELTQADLMEESDAPPPGQYVMVAIRDTGAGIDEKTLPHVFEPFFTTKAPGAGSGMGLAMLHGFVKQSNGTVRIESEVDKGTVVRLYFPVVQEDGAVDGEAVKSSVSAGTERVLLVEDEAPVRRTIARQLEISGYTVHVAENGKQALDIHGSEGPFDILVTDVVMPGPLQGAELAEQVRQKQPDIPIVFISGYAKDSALGDGSLFGSEPHLMKPVSMEALTSTMRRVLGNAQGNTASNADKDSGK